jgi:hypothetical protein
MRLVAVLNVILFVVLAVACSMGPGPSPQHKDTLDIDIFLQGRHDGNATFQMKCRLCNDKDYGGGFAGKEKEYLCVYATNEERAELLSRGHFNAYVLRDSEVGKQINDVLKDGGDHWLLITVSKYEGNPKHAQLKEFKTP